MFISVRKLELHEIQFSEQIKPDVIDFGSDVRQKARTQQLWAGQL